eukprot:scaffold36275_cov154-Isochrysis_galbana.AAC.24
MLLTKPPNLTRFATTGSVVVPGGSTHRSTGTSLVQSVPDADIRARPSMLTVPAGAITLMPETRTTLDDTGFAPLMDRDALAAFVSPAGATEASKKPASWRAVG